MGKSVKLPWRDEQPDSEGYWLRIESDGSLHSIYATKKDLEVMKTRPDWLGLGLKWCGPVELGFWARINRTR